jgi:hypothetical protein
MDLHLRNDHPVVLRYDVTVSDDAVTLLTDAVTVTRSSVGILGKL